MIIPADDKSRLPREAKRLASHGASLGSDLANLSEQDINGHASQQYIYALASEGNDDQVPPPTYDSININTTPNDHHDEAYANPSSHRFTEPTRQLHPHYHDSFSLPEGIDELSPPKGPRSLLSRVGIEHKKIIIPQPPSCFSRRPIPGLSYGTFPPVYLIGNGKTLHKGFPMMPPPSTMVPHPFATHDVNEADWTRLLGDIQRTGTLTGRQQTIAGIPTGIVPMAGQLVARAVRRNMKKNKGKIVGELVDIWNDHFFRPRSMEIVLSQGNVRLDSGSSPIPNLVPQTEQRASQNLNLMPSSPSSSPSSSSSSSSSSDNEDDRMHESSGGGLAERRERQFSRRMERRATKVNQSQTNAKKSQDGTESQRHKRCPGDNILRLFVVPI